MSSSRPFEASFRTIRGRTNPKCIGFTLKKGTARFIGAENNLSWEEEFSFLGTGWIFESEDRIRAVEDGFWLTRGSIILVGISRGFAIRMVEWATCLLMVIQNFSGGNFGKVPVLIGVGLRVRNWGCDSELCQVCSLASGGCRVVGHRCGYVTLEK